MAFFWLEPEVAGSWGESTVADRTTHPPVVFNLEYEIDHWLGDDLLQTFPCYIVTERLRDALESSGFTRFSFDDVTVITSVLFKEIERDSNPSLTLPKFYWLKVEGEAGKDDFGIENTLRPRTPAGVPSGRAGRGRKINIRRRGYVAAPWVGNHRLVVSERALSLLQSFEIEHYLVLRFHT
jgi:hypothetical protein